MTKKEKKHQLIIGAIWAVVAFCLMLIVCGSFASAKETYIEATGDQNVTDVMALLAMMFTNLALGDFNFDIAGFGLSFAVGFIIFAILQKDKKRNYRRHEEHGSARWATDEDREKLKVNKEFDKNLILTDTEAMEFKPTSNVSTIICGIPGTGKTVRYVIPNILQANANYIVTDPKGDILLKVGKFLEDHDYNVYYLDLRIGRLKESMNYNPLAFIKDESDIVMFADIFMASTQDDGAHKTDVFFDGTVEKTMMAIIDYMRTELPKSLFTFDTLVTMITEMKVSENDSYTVIDKLFDDLREKNPRHFGLRQYDGLMQAKSSPATMGSILISIQQRLTPFYVPEIMQLTSKNSLDILDFTRKASELQAMGKKSKVALFIIIDDAVKKYNFVANMLFQQLFITLQHVADFKYPGVGLPTPAHFIIDEFANIGKILYFDTRVTAVRSRNISIDIIIQSFSQIADNYGKDKAETIKNGFANTLFLGSSPKATDTNKEISATLGSETVDYNNISQTKAAKGGSMGASNQLIKRELMTPDEVGRMDTDYCILFPKGGKPFYSLKYQIQKHPYYKYMWDPEYIPGSEGNKYIRPIDASSLQEDVVSAIVSHAEYIKEEKGKAVLDVPLMTGTEADLNVSA